MVLTYIQLVVVKIVLLQLLSTGDNFRDQAIHFFRV